MQLNTNQMNIVYVIRPVCSIFRFALFTQFYWLATSLLSSGSSNFRYLFDLHRNKYYSNHPFFEVLWTLILLTSTMVTQNFYIAWTRWWLTIFLVISCPDFRVPPDGLPFSWSLYTLIFVYLQTAFSFPGHSIPRFSCTSRWLTLFLVTLPPDLRVPPNNFLFFRLFRTT